MSVIIGKEAPDFCLYDTGKQKVTLSEQKGKVVLLLFFPQAFTSTCTKELCGIRDDISRYSNAQATVFGISVDSLFSLKKFKEDQHYDFTLLSDFNKEVSAAYGILYETWILEMKGVSKRSAFVIDKEGILRYAEVLESAGDLPDFEAINAVLSSLSA